MVMTETAQTVKELSQMAGEAFNSVLPYLDQLAVKLGQTAQYLWMLQIKQGYVLVATMLIKFAMYSLLTYIAYKLAMKYRRWHNDKGTYRDMPYEIAFAPFIALSAFWIVSFWANVNIVLTLLFNIDYWAIQQLILLMKANVQF